MNDDDAEYLRALSLADFRETADWLPVASGLATLSIGSDHTGTTPAMRLDFDFKGGGGFVVARKTLSLPLPETYVLAFDVNGTAPANKLEIKLSDASGRNVWWWHQDAFPLHDRWRSVRIRSSEIEFAWGPAGGGALDVAGSIEIAIVAGPGGSGTVRIANLRIEDQTYRAVPRITASSGQPSEHLLDLSNSTGWRSRGDQPSQWLAIDFGVEREYGGLVIDWEPGRTAHGFSVHVSNDGETWATAYDAPNAAGERSYTYMPATRARHLRLDLRAPEGPSGFGIASIEIKPFEFSRSIDAFFANLARDAPRGSYPKYLSAEQTYWSPVGVADGSTCALLNEEGMVEVDKGAFSLEPFLRLDDRFITWADAEISQELADSGLPVPSAVWRVDGLALRTTAFATRSTGEPVLFIRYLVENTSARPRAVQLCAAIRPFQVTPPWQAYQGLGGAHSIHDIDGNGQRVRIDARTEVIVLGEPAGFGAAAFAQGSIVDALRDGAMPSAQRIHDSFGYASAALAFDLFLAPGKQREVYLAVPFAVRTSIDPRHSSGSGNLSDSRHDDGQMDPRLRGDDGGVEYARALGEWTAKLDAITLDLPDSARAYRDTFHSATAHVLVCRDGPALQPGPRRYTRSWIRDGAIMAAALLRSGHTSEACAFIRWYAQYQAADGNVPCCVDRNGPDWLVEHDSHGELIFTIMECFRFTGDRDFLKAMWPAALRAVEYIDVLRQSRLGPEYDTDARRARYGLLPESASHEGYLAHHVHSYWDDLWALRGLRDAAEIAATLDEREHAERTRTLADALRDSLSASIALTLRERNIDYMPGSVEWADFDPTATANGIALLDEVDSMPRAALDRTFDIYLEGVRKRRNDEIDWNNYSAYEIRIVGALVRMGRRDDANELADFFMSDRRPPSWNQWPEISWRNPHSPGHLGDLPHCWIGAEFMLAFRTMLVFERRADQSLIIGAGLRSAWLDGDGIRVADLPTYYGDLSFDLRRVSPREIALSLALPVEVEIVLQPPLAGPLTSVTVDGETVVGFDADAVRIRAGAREIVLRS